jgi:enoyl-CoA hydratase/carnithine racemase
VWCRAFVGPDRDAGTVRGVSSDTSGPEAAAEVLVERRDDGVVLVTLNRPKANALSIGMLGLLARSISGLSGDPPGALVLWGGERIFAAGADVTELSQPDAAGTVSDAFKAVTVALEDLRCPTIAAICGYALGGGLELALGCDFRVASTTSRLGQPEILLGIIPGGGGTQRLARLVGPARAKDMVMTGRQIEPDKALEWGLVDRVVDPFQVLETALEMGSSFAAGPRLALAASKRTIDRGLDSSLEAGLKIERDEFVALLTTNDARRGIESLLEHGPGKATFSGN